MNHNKLKVTRLNSKIPIFASKYVWAYTIQQFVFGVTSFNMKLAKIWSYSLLAGIMIVLPNQRVSQRKSKYISLKSTGKESKVYSICKKN